MTDSVVAAEPMPFRVLLDEAMKLMRRHFRAIYPAVAIPVAVVAALSLAVQLRWIRGAAAAGSAGPNIASGCLAIIVALLLTLGVQGLSYSVLTAACVDGATGRPIDMRAKWSFVFKPDTFGTLLLMFLAIAGGFLCLVLPGVYIGLLLSFVIPVMAVEGLRGGSALGRSWRLMRYNPHKRFFDNSPSKIFALYFVGALMAYAVSFVIELPFTAMQGYRIARAAASGQAPAGQTLAGSMFWWQIPSTVLSSLVSTAIGVFTSFGLVLLYQDVVRRKEGVDLAAAIQTRFTPGAPPQAGPSA
jgi:hypothetical protein